MAVCPCPHDPLRNCPCGNVALYVVPTNSYNLKEINSLAGVIVDQINDKTLKVYPDPQLTPAALDSINEKMKNRPYNSAVKIQATKSGEDKILYLPVNIKIMDGFLQITPPFPKS